MKRKINFFICVLAVFGICGYIGCRFLCRTSDRSDYSVPITPPANLPREPSLPADRTAADDIQESSAPPPQDDYETQRLEEGRRLLTQGRSDEALKIYSAIIDSTTNYDHLQSTLARFFIVNRDCGKLNDEIERRETQLAFAPENIRLLEVLAYLYQYSMATEQEIAVRNAIGLKNNDAANLQRLSALYEKTEDWNALAEVYEKLAAANPTGAFNSLVNKAKTEIKANRPDDAKETCARLLAMGDLSVLDKAAVAGLLGLAGDNQQALIILESCLEQAQTPGEHDRYLLEIYRAKVALGERDKALRKGLSTLAESSELLGVRIGATNLLSQMNP